MNLSKNSKKLFPGSECISASKMEHDEIKAGRPYGGESRSACC